MEPGARREPEPVAVSSLMTSTAAAPSVICDELPGGDHAAVGLERGLERGEPLDASCRAGSPRRGVNVDDAVVGRDRHRHDLALEAPLVGRPRGARGATRRENASCSSRLMPHFSAISSAEMPCGTRSGSARASAGRTGSTPGGTTSPSAPGVMLSTPAAITTSYAPAITPCAAKWSACCDEPHCRSIDRARHGVGEAGGERGVAPDVAGLVADLR